VRTVGVDLLAFAALQTLQNSSIDYAPLFALPVLMASILGSLLIAMATAAGVTLLLFGYAGWLSVQTPWDSAAHFFQAALTGAGCFAISFIASQLASRLASAELKAQRSQLAEAVQRQVNELVIESLTEGVLVVDERYLVRAANPAAYLLIGANSADSVKPLDLATQLGWQGLHNLVGMSFASLNSQHEDITIRHEGRGPRRLHVRTQ
jgi:two-component system sensor histidine kinase PilS (NtrC family)